MSSSTEARIEELCSRIRVLCRGLFSPEAETEVRKLARELRLAIRQHVGMAKYSLAVKKAAIVERDPENGGALKETTRSSSDAA